MLWVKAPTQLYHPQLRTSRPLKTRPNSKDLGSATFEMVLLWLDTLPGWKNSSITGLNLMKVKDLFS